jgi:uncharacterized protein DUF1326
VNFRVRGSYLESCNCEAICPCRTIAGVPGGRSTHGVCYGVLTWRIEDGHVGDEDVSGLAVALVYSYDDDEEGSPWSLVLHVDERGDAAQRAALERVFLHELRHLPWIRKAREIVAVRPSRIEAGEDGVRIGSAVSLRAGEPVDTDLRVTCIVPGHERLGRELYAEELKVEDGPFAWELSGNCAYAADFDYAST